jgi:hypothetical protein
MAGERNFLPFHRTDRPARDPERQHPRPWGGGAFIGGFSSETTPIVASMSITVRHLKPVGGTWHRPCCDVEVLINYPMRPTSNSGFWEALSVGLRHALDWDLTCAHFPRRPTSHLAVIVVTGVPEDSLDAPLVDAMRGYLEDKGYLQRGRGGHDLSDVERPTGLAHRPSDPAAIRAGPGKLVS